MNDILNISAYKFVDIADDVSAIPKYIGGGTAGGVSALRQGNSRWTAGDVPVWR